MRLSDVIGSMDISTYPQIALVIFLSVFAAVCVRLFKPGMKDTCSQARLIPLQEDVVMKRKDVAP